MPYKTCISFNTAKTLVHVFEIMSTVSPDRALDVEQILEHTLAELPSFQEILKYPFAKTKSLNTRFNQDLQYLTNLFTNTFVYWSEYNLLGLIGTEQIIGSTVFSHFPCHINFSSSEFLDEPENNYTPIHIFDSISKSIMPYPKETRPDDKTHARKRINKAISDMLHIPDIMNEQSVPDTFVIRTTLLNDENTFAQIKQSYFDFHHNL